MRDFSRGPVVKILCFRCRAHGLGLGLVSGQGSVPQRRAQPILRGILLERQAGESGGTERLCSAGVVPFGLRWAFVSSLQHVDFV